MTDTGLQLRSTVKQDNTLELTLVDVPIPEPGPDEVLVQVEAAPLNPSDLALLFGPADLSTARTAGTDARPVVTADIPADMMKMVAGRVGESLAVGNEAAGMVIAAGASDAAQALMVSEWELLAVICTASTAASMRSCAWNWRRERQQPRARPAL